MVSREVTLPTDEELTVEECNLSFPYLRAGAFHLGKACEVANNEFMLCKEETKDPRKCLYAGKLVTACTMNFFRQVKGNCKDEFHDYARCLDVSSPTCRFEKCRKTQAIFDTCMLEKLNMERPAYGYYSEIKIHDTVRPKPAPEPPLVIVDPLPQLPKVPEGGWPHSRGGNRTYGVY